MANDIMRILGKKGKLTGAEVGNLVIKQVVYQLANKTDRELFSKAELETASNSLTESSEIKAFNKRVAIANFLDEMTSRGSYADLLISQKYAVTQMILEKIKLSLQFMEEEPLRFTYKGYEAYQQEKLEDFLTDENGDREVSLFEAILEELKGLYDKDKEAQELMEACYRDKKLNDKEKAFYGDEYKDDTIDGALPEKIRELLTEESNYKEVIKYMAKSEEENDLFSNTTAQKKPFDKCDLAYDLATYWDASDKSENTFKEIITDYKEILAYALKAVDKEHFRGKLAKVKLEDTYKKRYTLRELQDTYDYSFIGDALENKPILITQYGVEETLYDREKIEAEVLRKILDKDTLLMPLTALEETIVFIKNINIIFDLLAEETGLEDIKSLKFDTEDYKNKLDETYRQLALNYVHLKLVNVAEEETEFLRTIFKNLGNLIVKDEVASEKRINKARELLRSPRNFRDYRTEFFYTVLGRLGA